MTNLRPSPPKLAIPASHGSPSAVSATIQTGRPSMWSKSAQRKMTRLYVYTTLPLAKIVALVHSHTPGTAPGHESAHKKLNILLDKEPRWLHPKTNEDMDRRITELANSPTRLKSAEYAAFGHSRSTFDNSSISPSPQRLETEDSVSPALFDVSPLHRPAATFTSNQPADGALNFWVSPGARSSMAMSPAEDAADPPHFAKFLRQTTCLSNATSNTTGSFQRVLSDFSEPYVQTVKRLVKRFTAPMGSRPGLSPYSEGSSAIETWADEEDCPPEFNGRPFPIPSDFLNLDEYQSTGVCYSTHDVHDGRRCLCFMPLDTCVLPWVTRQGLTPVGQRLLSNGPREQDFGPSDSFGNTVLHFLAARGSYQLVERSLRSDLCKSRIEAKNSAGQTFLHVLNASILRNPDHVENLLEIVTARGYDLHMRDHYGRSFFHLLQAGGHPKELIQRVSRRCDGNFYMARDAFGFTPARNSSTMMDLDEPNVVGLQDSFGPAAFTDAGLTKESKLLENVRKAMLNPHLQDEEGRNGLHCLAMATLSEASVVNKYHLQSSQRDKVTKKGAKPERELDSSSCKLGLRLGLLSGLLDAGVDPNQHDNNGNTPLMTFVAELPEEDDYKIPPKILQLLIARGANIHARNRRGETALHIAVRCGRKLAMRALFEKGANVHARDSAGRSLLDVADVKMLHCDSDEHMREYAHYEACRAWLSGKGLALQGPSVIDEWGGGVRA
ncbi:ankyrin repeat protein [Metarhizium guizhouense ARSEF 977]|uniref:Ankyrin repeat protein n=1 Tax=Metarhizium guizhouense (strain ARSEF 977) TaxID=1276136 RepID=A0A0B4GZY9_METGA|nr:ankyrin repeat protein [Metarhizium guizhouense ARSEF 977]